MARRRIPMREEAATPRPPDANSLAIEAGAAVLVEDLKVRPDVAKQAFTMAITAYVLTQAKLAWTRPDILDALRSENPFKMAALIDMDLAEEAVVHSAIPLLAEIAQEVDPAGTLPFFQYPKDAIVRMIAASISCWVEGEKKIRERRSQLRPDQDPHPSMLPARPEPRPSSASPWQLQDDGTYVNSETGEIMPADEIPF